jgi:hypothetical protein
VKGEGRKARYSPAGRGADARARLDAYSRLIASADPDLLSEATREALRDGHQLLAARAAEQCGERLLYALEADLIAAYQRLLDRPVKVDPNCIVKAAIARALVALDCQDVDFYLAGIAYRQLEPVWGGSLDTAVDIRVSCAMGLAATAYPRALVELVTLLYDPEPNARSGAARAIACTEPLAAEAVLRAKALSGDAEPAVIGECLAGLLQVAPEDAPGFVDRFLDHAEPELRELAALALGASGLAAALELLCARWEAQPLKQEADRVLLRAAVLHRSEPAFDWLIDVVRDCDRASAELVVRELALYRGNVRLRERLEAAVAARADPLLADQLRDAWGA